MGNYVFISYSHKDSEFISELDDYLRDFRITIWKDNRNLDGGQIWNEEIKNALKDCKYFLIALSKYSVKSEEVKKELDAALGDARQAIEYYEQALTIAREIGNRRVQGNALGNLGSAFYRLDDIDKSQDYCQQQLRIAQEIGDRYGEANALWGQAICLQKKNDPVQAIEKAESALRIFEQIESPSASTMRELLAEWKK